ncbi:hypothetical protein M2432_003740 [Mycobacterium sp. OTB74]|nr:hypothetical protein [Mycobacterium sp. OTB74]
MPVATAVSIAANNAVCGSVRCASRISIKAQKDMPRLS